MRALTDIWLYVQHREGVIEAKTYGLIAEARRLIVALGGRGTVTAVAIGPALGEEIKRLGMFGADRVLSVEGDALSRYEGEVFAEILFKVVKAHEPTCILMAQGPETADLSARLAASMETPLVTRAVDLKIDKEGTARAVRPVANGYLFEELTLVGHGSPIICFLPSVLGMPEEDGAREAEIVRMPPDISSLDTKTRVEAVIEAAPETLGLEDADIVVSGGRGVGKGESFDIIHELALVMGGSVGGTRPVVDWQILPFERQIGQTGKTVDPHLILACGISGANEFTAGMEKSRKVIAINTDPHARIFRFADLAVIGDVHEILPLLIARIKEVKGNGKLP
ncbi:MAG: electron transfer flavoprotein subunit alpha/FixB family protein [Desulfatiglandales bacterium]